MNQKPNNTTTFLFLLILLSICSIKLSAFGVFQYDAKVSEVYAKIQHLQLNEAKIQLQTLRQNQPNNLALVHLEDYYDFFLLYLSENENELSAYKKRLDERLMAMQKGSPDSPYYLYVQADMLLHWALLKIKFNDYLATFNAAGRAYRLLKRNQEKFPAFILNYKNLGLLHALAGTIPDQYRWGAKLLGGLSGTIEQGKNELEKVLAHAEKLENFLFAEESAVMYSMLLLYLANEPDAAWQACEKYQLQPATNPVHCFTKATIALRSGRNDEAIQILSKRIINPGEAPFPFLDFLLGLAKIRRLDDESSQAFQRFLQHFKGQNYLKEAYQKLAWIELLQGDKTAYQNYMKRCLEKGQSNYGADQHAQAEAESGQIPNTNLLKARLLFDGGYYQKAYDLLKDKDEKDFSPERLRLEYNYRLGRILHGLKRYPEALQQYQKTIQQGAQSSEYFACNAALQAGLLCEKRKQFDSARHYFKRCLQLQPREYKNSLHQAAKAGLNRIGD
jgi:Tetratricopeptide repeat